MHHVSAAAIIREVDGEYQVFSARRTEPAHLAGGWEFPGGKVDEGEVPEETVHREIWEELKVQIEVLAKLPGPLADGAWPMPRDYVLHVFVAEIINDGVPLLHPEHDACEWVPISEPDRVAWLEQDLAPLAALTAWLKSR